MSDDFKKLIDADRAQQEKYSWEGTLLEYLEILKKNPEIANLSHKRMYDSLISAGVEEINLDDDPKLRRLFKGKRLKKFQFFDEFYGMDKTLNQIIRYFHSAALRGEESRQVLYLVGPVGSGKSSLLELSLIHI